MNIRIQKIKDFLIQNPNDLFLNHALALEYIKVGEDELAKKCFELNAQNDEKYVATYYHLGKLQERIGDTENALKTYEKGMIVAKEINDNHSYNELQSAHEDLVDL